MAGFVVFEEDRAWGVSNAAWRAILPAAGELLPEENDARLIIERATRDGFHYLDLQRLLPSDREAIKNALSELRRRHVAGELSWGDAAWSTSMRRALDGLLRMFDDPEMGRSNVA